MIVGVAPTLWLYAQRDRGGKTFGGRRDPAPADRNSRDHREDRKNRKKKKQEEELLRGSPSRPESRQNFAQKQCVKKEKGETGEMRSTKGKGLPRRGGLRIKMKPRG